MTYKLGPTSPRRADALAFGTQLRRAMTRMKIGRRRLEKLAGVGDTSIANYRAGLSLPHLETAHRLADALQDDQLITLIVKARTFTCPIDERTFVYDGEGPRTYCSPSCQRVAEKKRAGRSTRARAYTAENRVTLLQQAVDAMCRSCEPNGLCRTADCPLRAASPLPLAVSR